MERLQTDLNGRFLTWLSPEWLVRLRMESADTRDENGEPAKALKVSDCAATLAVLGRWTNVVVDPDYDTDAAIEIESDVEPRDPTIASVTWQQLRNEIGVPGRRDVNRVIDRMEFAMANGQRVFDKVYVDLQGRCQFFPNYNVRYAHPLRSIVRQAVPIDVLKWGQFSCLHSIPIAARLVVWLSTRCRVGQSRADARYGSDSYHMRIPADRVVRDLGITMKAFLPNRLPIEKIVADLRTIGIQAEMSWSYIGRTPDLLVIRAWRSRYSLHVQPAVEGRLSRGNEWRLRKALFNATRRDDE